MITVYVPVYFDEYCGVRDDLEERFDKHAIPIWLSADSVLRTWAGLTFYEWFENQGVDVGDHIGWGEIRDGSPEELFAAVGHNFPEEWHNLFVAMIFHADETSHGITDNEDEARQRQLAIMFKLAHGGQ